MLRVCVIDDQELAILGLRAYAKTCQTFEIVREFTCPITEPEALNPELIDLVMYEYYQRGKYHFECLEGLLNLYPDLRMLVFSSQTGEEQVLRAMKAGATGFLNKHCRLEELHHAMTVVARGEIYLHSSVAHHFVMGLRSLTRAEPDRTKLSQRQTEILRLMADGHSTKSIAAELGISRKTVESHRSQLMATLDVHDLAGLIRYAIQHPQENVR